MSMGGDYLYQRLPAVYRTRDAALGGPLQALLNLFATRAAQVETDIDGLYQNWFIETCADWAVPYIGDLLGVKLLRSAVRDVKHSPRALIADTLELRRRKGTVTALERLTYDCTGWRCHAVEFFELLETTQNVNHVRLANVRTPDLRNSAHLELLNTAFDDIAHTVAVKHLPNGWYNIPNVGLFVWRLQNYPLTKATAFAVSIAPGLYKFDPLGRDQPLFNNPPPLKRDDFSLTSEIDMPAPLRRRALFDELRARRANGVTPGGYFSGQQVVVGIVVDGQPVPPEQIYICQLADPSSGPPPTDWPRPGPAPVGALAPNVAIDPEVGRLSLPPGVTPHTVIVSYSYGFPGDIGGGPYDRSGTGSSDPTAPAVRQSPSDQLWLVPSAAYATLADALAALGGLPPGTRVIVQIVDSATYDAGVTLNVPKIDVILQGANFQRPVLHGNLTISGDATTLFALNGVALNGSLTLQGPLQAVKIVQSTISPQSAGLQCLNVGDTADLSMYRSICGPIVVTGALNTIELSECIVDGGAGGSALAAPNTVVSIDRCTLLGTSQMTTLQLATNTIFTDLVFAARRQEGCVRFSYVPPGSTTPRRYRCQPDLATQNLSDPGAIAAASVRLTPSFTSEFFSTPNTNFASPGYTQLSAGCATEITTGADNGSEMGVWNFLQQPQREANLNNALDDFLRFGLEAALIEVT